MDKLIFSDEELIQLSKYATSNSVAELLEKFGGDIDKLKSYIKWIYKYGGTGSKGNDWKETSANWSINAFINNQLIKNPFLLDSKKTINTVSVSIGKPGADSYTVSVYYKKETDSEPQLQGNRVTLTAENNLCSIPVRIVNNGTLSIIVKNNSDDEQKTISAECILNAHITNLSLIDNNENKYVASNGVLALTSISNGFKLRINHRIYVDGQNPTLNISINHPKGSYTKTIELGQYGKNNEINNYYTDIDLYGVLEFANYINSSSEEIAGTYFFTYELEYTYNGPQSDSKSSNITLIPANELYLLVRPVISNAKFYTIQQQLDNPDLYLFNSKKIKFYITAYKPGGGSVVLDVNRTGLPTISYVFESNSPITKTITCDNDPNNIHENEIEFTLFNDATRSESKTYKFYVYLDKQSTLIDWFDPLIGITREYKFIDNSNNIEYIDDENRNNLSLNILNQYQNNGQGPLLFDVVNNIEANHTDNTISIYNDNTSYSEGQDLLISIGIQYNEINDSSKKIFELNFGNTSNIFIYQNKVVINKTSDVADSEKGSEIFIPIEENYDATKDSNYHLLNILVRKAKNLNKYELLFYIDGLMENAYSQVFIKNNPNSLASSILLKNIICYEGNYAVNFIDVAYLLNTSIDDDISQITDNDILQYYYRYQYDINSTDENILDTIDDFIKFKDIYDNIEEHDIYVNDSISTTVYKIKDANNRNQFYASMQLLEGTDKQYDYGAPILLVTFDLSKENITSEDVNDFFTTKFVIQYLEGINPLSESPVYGNTRITWINDATDKRDCKALYSFKLQGSSTGQFKSKNFTISAQSTDNVHTTLFTPNFKASTSPNIHDDDYLTFLPEKSFTCKADAVDSTHSNNTSIGLFINKNTTPFSDARTAQGNNANKYKNYIKNCLYGFPILVFFEFPLSNENYEYYYMGIYNFNLGRESYLNLGYYNLENIFNNLHEYGSDTIVDIFDGEHNGFNEYEIITQEYQPLNEAGENKEGLTIAEIQGGNSYFDFSQFDSTILFGYDNKEMMFGDFYSTKGSSFGEFEKNKVQDFVHGVSLIGGKLFENLHKNLSTSVNDNYGYDLSYNNHIQIGNKYYITRSSNSVPNYHYQIEFKTTTSSQSAYEYVWKTNTIDSISDNNIIEFLTKFIGVESNDESSTGPIDFNYDHNTNQFVNLLDYTSLVEYFTICMALGLVDSVMKNLNIKAFKKNGKFYIAFYDMDTALSRDNGGKYVSPFAFSDYWISILNNNTTENVIYRDFYPNKELQHNEKYINNIGDLSELSNIPTGYDIPSSYLFAIAKYAQVFYDAKSLNISSNYNINPNYYWYTLRHSENSPLANPNVFINNYFTKNIDKINKTLFGLNYRFKYLQKDNKTDNGMFDTENLNAFHGRGLYSLKYWLSQRFHILDAYFNIKESNIPYQEYNINTNTWSNINLGSEDNMILVFDPKFSNVINGNITSTLSNTDIEINSSMFGNAAKFQGADRSTSIKALPYSPMMFIYQSSSEQFICIDPNTLYSFYGEPKAQGEVTILYGGSINWTYAQNLSPFIQKTGELAINNKNLQNVNVTSGSLSTFSPTNMQSLIELNITSENATCNINLDATNNMNSLQTINLSGSKCSLNIDGLNVKNINLSNISAQSTYTIRNCKYLNNVVVNNTYGTKLEVIPVWKTINSIDNKGYNIISNADGGIQTISLTNTLYDDLSLIIENDNIVTNITAIGYSSVVVRNCSKLEKIIVNESDTFKLKKLHIINCGTNAEVELDIVINNKSKETDFYGNKIIDLSSLEQLTEISFESTLGFNTIILPSKDNIKLQAKAFYNTQLEYINFNGEIKPLILCDSEDGDCSIFAKSSFTLLTSDEHNLEFKVLEKETSLKNIFNLPNQTRMSLDDKNRVSPGITYKTAEYFISNLGNKQYVTSLSYAFHRQTNISGIWEGFINGHNSYVDQFNEIDPTITKLITLEGYIRLKDISCMFEHTSINFVDENFFGISNDNYCAKNVETFDITNFMHHAHLALMHINSLSKIKDKIPVFLFTGNDDTNATRTCNPLNRGITIYDDNEGICSVVNLHEFLFSDNPSQLTQLSEFKITNKMYLSGLFTDKQISITSIVNVCNNLNQSKNEFNSNIIDSINNLSLAPLLNLEILSNSFTAYEYSSINEIDPNKCIRMVNYLNWTTQYSKLLSNINSGNIFNFYKIVDFTDSIENENWQNLWNSISGLSVMGSTISVNYLFNKSIFIMENDTDSLVIPRNQNNQPINNIINAVGLFKDSTCYVNNSEVGITLSNNSISSLTSVETINYMFDNCLLNGTNNYPLPENLLSELFKLKNTIGMFSNTRISGDHKTYTGNLSKKIYYQHILNNGNNIVQNYKLTDNVYKNVIGSTTTLSDGYQFIPNIFDNNIYLTNISEMFKNSDFEGYIHESLFINNTNLRAINNFINNCKILPQIYKEFNESDNLSNIYNYEYIEDNKTTAYVFIPDHLFYNCKEIIIDNLFTFNLLVSDTNKSRIYLITNKSLELYTGIIRPLGLVELNTNNTSRLINKWYLNEESGQTNTYIANIQNINYTSVINLCINNEGNNIYSEGITINQFNNNLINDELASVYYGYVFKKNTVLYNINTTSNFVSCFAQINNPVSANVHTDLKLSANIILPAVLELWNIDSNKFADNYVRQYYIGSRPSGIKNPLYKNYLFVVNSDNHEINENIIDLLDITKVFTISENAIQQQKESIYEYKYELKYNNVTKLTKIYESDIPNDPNLSELNNNIINDFKQMINTLIYYNYSVLFNSWNLRFIGNESIAPLLTYEKIKIRLTNNTIYYAQSNEQEQLERYKVSIESIDGVSVITNIENY